MNQLWYKEEAKTWVEALPLGNGRLGAMMFSGVKQERSHSMKTHSGLAIPRTRTPMALRIICPRCNS